MDKYIVRLRRIWPVAVIFLVWLIFSSPYFFKGLVPFPSDYLVSFFPPWNSEYGMPVKNNAMPDVITQIYPWKKLTIDTWKSGAIPLWNPYSFSGTPHAANYQTAVFSPLNILFFVIPFLDAWSFLIILQPITVGIGIYLFLISLGRSRTGALLGAIGFMFCGFITTWMAYGTLGWAIAGLPWALWSIHRYMTKPARWFGVVLSVSLAISFLSGHFQISLYVLGATFAFIVYLSLKKRQISQGITLILYVLLGLLVAMPQFFLAYDTFRASTRIADIGKIEVIPWRYFLTILIPDFFGNPVTRNDWFGHYAEWASYIGVIPLIFALFAIGRRGKDERLFFILLAILAILMAFPTPINDLLYALKIPVLSTSASSRIIVLLSFSVSALAAFGFDDWKAGKTKNFRRFACMGFVLLGLIWAVLIIGNILPQEKLAIAKRNSILPTAIAASGFALLLVGAWKKKKVMQAAIIGLVCIAAFDSYRYASKWMPFEDRKYVYPTVESTEFLRSRIGNDRIFGNIGSESSGMFGLPVVEGYDAMYQGRYAQFINAASSGELVSGDRSVVQFDKHGRYKTEVLKLLGVRYIYHRMSDGRNIWTFPYWEYTEKNEMKIIYNDEKYQIYEYADAFPRVFLASSYKVITDDGEILHTLFDKEFNARETLILEKTPDLAPAPGAGNAEIVSYKPISVLIHSDSEAPKLLFLSDVYDPGWQATVDGKKTNIIRADYDFRAIAIPSGKHVIEFTYSPQSFRFGFIISGIAILLLTGTMMYKRS